MFYLTDDSRKVINFVHAANESGHFVQHTRSCEPDAVILPIKDTKAFLKEAEKHFKQEGVVQSVLNTYWRWSEEIG